MANDIQQLSDLISSSVTALLQACNENNTPFPGPNEPFTPESEAYRSSKAVVDATNVIAAAAMQLAQRVLPPYMSIMTISAGHLKCAALSSAIELNVTEVLREAGPEVRNMTRVSEERFNKELIQGLHIDEIAKKCNVDGDKLSGLLRILTLDQCYREVAPDVFANTRVSSALDTGKSVAQLFERPDEKHDGTDGYVALIEHLIGDGAKFSCHLLDNLRDPKTAFSHEVTQTPFNRAIGKDIPLWDWYNLPEETYRRQRFAIAMRGIALMQARDVLADAIDWKTLPEGALVVDVGGGIGTSAVSVAKHFKHIKFIVQDLPSVCKEGEALWNEQDPDIIKSGQLQFMPHDFFTTQPVKDASVFLLTQIIHDWSDANCDRILKALRAAATPDTKLVILGNIVAHGCRDTSDKFEYNKAPLPLQPNFGAANIFGYVLDLTMMVFLNSQERTLMKLDELLRRSGWKIVDVKRHDPPSNFNEPVVAVPF
ncbi:hypothetical protein H0H92_007144 [Tricholoma furcatifolium]|nr:hypothetical protein H0H92_007144 [Tricholoma furcatifolium]